MLSDTPTNWSNSFVKLKREDPCIVHFQAKALIIASVGSETLSSGHITLGYSHTHPKTICSALVNFWTWLLITAHC